MSTTGDQRPEAEVDSDVMIVVSLEFGKQFLSLQDFDAGREQHGNQRVVKNDMLTVSLPIRRFKS